MDATVTELPIEERRALLQIAPTRRRRCAASSCLDGDAAVGARLARRVGRRDREAARIAVRTPALEALAEDEVRGVAGAGRRRLHRSAGCARRTGRAARRLLRGRRLRLCRQGRHRLRHEAAARSAPAVRRDRTAHAAVHEGHRPAARARALGSPGDRRAGGVHRVDLARQAASSRVSSACASTRTRATSSESSRDRARRHRDHSPRQGAVPGGRHHQGRARGVLRSGRAGDRCRTCAAGR